MKLKASHGEYINGRPPYGYRRDPERRNHLIPDENMAPVVKRMFDMAFNGCTNYQIARAFKEEKIPRSGAYKLTRDGRYVLDPDCEDPFEWSRCSVRDMLSNQTYLGHLFSQKTSHRCFKDKRVIHNPEEAWIKLYIDHEALVDEEVFRVVQERTKVKKRRVVYADTNTYKGLMYCADCGYTMSYSRRKSDHNDSIGYYSCGQSRKHGNVRGCSHHYIKIEQVNELVLANIKRLQKWIKKDELGFVNHISTIAASEQETKRAALYKELAENEKRTQELDVLIQRMYEDHIFGRLSDSRYYTLSDSYEKECEELKNRVKEIKISISRRREMSRDAVKFVALMKGLDKVTEISKDLVYTLIEKICIHEKTLSKDGGMDVQVDIYYRHIGNIGDGKGHALIAPRIRRKNAANPL